LRIKIWAIFLIIFFGCTKVKNNFPDLLVPSIESKLTIKKLVSEYGQLRGKGSTTIFGKQSGKFDFSFTSNGYDTFLLFRDILGRKILLLEIHGDSISAWDMIQNQRYSKTSLVILFPFTEYLSPEKLTTLLWGFVPNLDNDINNKFEFENKNVKMTFESNKERIGSMIQKIVYIDEFNMDKYEINIITREYGSHYTDLEKGIPKSIPMMNP
tara:strand:- start:1384 stop:2019 length:636 start_codon:yes stop_codon:yes gene_type:complete